METVLTPTYPIRLQESYVVRRYSFRSCHPLQASRHSSKPIGRGCRLVALASADAIGTGSGSEFESSPASQQWLPTFPAPKKSIAGLDQSNLRDPKTLADSDSLFESINGVDVHYKVSKPFSALTTEEEKVLGSEGTLMIGSPAILLHGFGAPLYTWHRVIRPISSLLGAEALSFDRPAFGLTSRLKPLGSSEEENQYSARFSARASISFAEKLSNNPAVLIAHSAGSLVAIDAVLTSPDRFKALILIAPAIVTPLTYPWLLNILEGKKEDPGSSPKARHPIVELGKVLGKLLAASISLVIGRICLGFIIVCQRLPQVGHLGEEGLGEKNWVRMVKSMAATVVGALRLLLIDSALVIIWTIKNLQRAFQSPLKAAKRSLCAAIIWLLRSPPALATVRFLVDVASVKAVKLAWHDPVNCTDATLAEYTKPIRCKDWDKAMAEYVIATIFKFPYESAKSINLIKCPVLVVVGDDDKIWPGKRSEKIAKLIPGAKLVTIKDCGHLPHEEKPAEFMALVRSFLATAF